MKRILLAAGVFVLFLLAGCTGEEKALSLAEEGKKIAEAKGCVVCHSTDGTMKKAPTWLGLYGEEIETEDGQRVVADDNFVRESILEPQAKITKGYGDKAKMPSFKDRITDEEIVRITEYMKTLKE